MTKFSLLIATLGIAITNSFAQKTIHGYVLDEGKKPIPYVNIGIINSNVGTISNEDGSFQILIPDLHMKDTLIFSALGYGRASFPVALLPHNKKMNISLTEKVTTLETITIIAKKEKKETYWLGNGYEKGGFFYADSVSAGSAMALLIENKYPAYYAYYKDLTFPLYIGEATLRIKSNEMGKFKVRVRLLEVDSVTKLPGRDLFNQSLVITSDIKSGWLSFDLTPFSLKIENPPFYLVFEWILNDSDRLNLLTQYKEFKKAHPEKVRSDTLVVRGEKISFYSYYGFSPAVYFATSPIPFSLNNYVCYVRTNSFGEWKRSPTILTARISLSNQPMTSQKK